MVIAALVIAIVSATTTIVGLYFARRAAQAANTATRIELDRRHAELRPRFRVTCQRVNPGGEQLRLVIELTGPPDLERLDDELIVTIRDASFFRRKAVSSLVIPSSEPTADHVWGPVRFVPGTGPGVGTRPGAQGADAAGRETRSSGMPVGEAHVYALEPNPPPPGASWTSNGWRADVGTTLRLRIEGRRDGWESWTAVGEVDAGGDLSSAEMP